MTFTSFPEFPDYSLEPYDFHAIMNVTLGELIQDGYFDYEDEDWKWDYYSEEQYLQVMKKFVDHYFYRELGIMPVRAWKMRYLNFMNEIMPKYKYAYQLLDEGINILQDSDTYTKNRRVYSQFPATQLNTVNQDFASDANDFQSETVVFNNWMDTMKKLKHYRDVDLMIIEDCEQLFSCFFTTHINSR